MKKLTKNEVSNSIVPGKYSNSTELLNAIESHSDRKKKAIKSLKSEKSKSEFDLTNLAEDQSFDNLRLPPPSQFSDAPPLPPDEFRDPPTTIDDILNNIPIPDLATWPGTLTAQIHELKMIPQRKTSIDEQEANGIDNPLYHQVIYPPPVAMMKPPAPPFAKPPFLKSQSSNDLLTNTKIRDLIEKRQEKEQIKKKAIECPAPPQLLEFEKWREEFQNQIKYKGSFYSDFPKSTSSDLPYFHISDEYRPFSPSGLHLIICVHGLDGNSADLRLVRTYLELGLPGAHLEFLMSERNQGDTFSDFETMTDRLVAEVLCHIEMCGLNPTRISFVAHSLGTIIVRSALSRPQMRPLLSRLHTFLSLSGPHLGTIYNNSGLVNMGKLLRISLRFHWLIIPSIPRPLVYAKVEKVRIASTTLLARFFWPATMLSLSTKSAEYVASLQERPALWFESGSLCATAFGPIGAVQGSAERYINFRNGLQVRLTSG